MTTPAAARAAAARSTAAAPWLTRADARPVALLVGLSLLLHVVTSALVTHATAMRLTWLAAFFDGYLYLDIARSFPLPYAPQALDYASHAPGYPALVYLMRRLVPISPANWGAFALAASWLPSALSCGAFYGLCRAAGIRPFWPSVAFTLANPRWLMVAATAHPEGLAMLFTLLAATAQLRGRLGGSVVWLSLAGLTRYPAFLVGIAFFFDSWVMQRRRDLRTLATLAVPPLVFAAFHLYLLVRIPGFAGLADSHRAFLDDTGFAWPFAILIRNLLRWLQGTAPGPNFALTYLSVAFYLACLALGLRERDRASRMFSVWVAAIVLFHASLAGDWGALDFARLVILAWPAALLLLWRRVRVSAPPAAAAAGWTLAGALSVAVAVDVLSGAVRWQRASYPWPSLAIRRLAAEEPRWIDFSAVFERPAASPTPESPSP